MGYKGTPCLDSVFTAPFLAILLLFHKLEISTGSDEHLARTFKTTFFLT